MRLFVVAKVIVLNEHGEMLVLRRSQSDIRRPGQWDFPGGHVDDGEDMRAAAFRETVEESGIVLADAQLAFAMSEMTEHGSGTWLVFMATAPADSHITLSSEHDAFQWMKPEAFLVECTYDRQKKMVRYVADTILAEN